MLVSLCQFKAWDNDSRRKAFSHIKSITRCKSYFLKDDVETRALQQEMKRMEASSREMVQLKGESMYALQMAERLCNEFGYLLQVLMAMRVIAMMRLSRLPLV
jgi:hypothetical protein